MATWEDGPEYAPLQRPEGFAVPDLPPLEIAVPPPEISAGAPLERPQFFDPQAPVAPLATLVPEVGDKRDPGIPFEVVASTVTAGSSNSSAAWGAAHWSAPAQQPVSVQHPASPVQHPASSVQHPTSPVQHPGPWPEPGGLAAVGLGPAAPAPGQFPAAGTPQWFGPGPAYPARANTPPTMKNVVYALTPGLAIVLGVGGLIWPAAPFVLCIAFALSTRVTVAKQQVTKLFISALSVLGLMTVVGGLIRGDSLGDWYHYVGLWAVLLCWVVLCVGLLLVRSQLLKGPAGPGYGPPTTSRWG